MNQGFRKVPDSCYAPDTHHAYFPLLGSGCVLSQGRFCHFCSHASVLNYDHDDDNSYHLSRAYQVAGTGLGFYLCCGDASR